MTEKERRRKRGGARNTAAVSRPCYPQTTLPQSQGQLPLCLPLFMSVSHCPLSVFVFLSLFAFPLTADDPVICLYTTQSYICLHITYITLYLCITTKDLDIW